MTNNVAIVTLDLLAESCRRGLKSLAEQPNSQHFFGFPKGSCGFAAEIVGRILNEHAGYEGQYVCGTHHRRLGLEQSHAWYEVEDYIIDITYDQFEGTGLSGWVFRRGGGWHAEFSEFERRDGYCMPINWPCYPYDGYSAVVKEIVSLKFNPECALSR